MTGTDPIRLPTGGSMKSALRTALFVLALTLASACKEGKQTSDSEASAVDTANTTVKFQGEIGFCWSYAAVAMIESDYKKRTGREIDLSEEAIAFFHFAEQLKAKMDWNLRWNEKEFELSDGGWINGTSKKMGSKDAFSLIEHWGLIPESQWIIKFEDELKKKKAIDSINKNFLSLQEKIRGKQTSVQMNQIFEILTKEAFASVPPVDGFNNGSGQMNAVQYARNVIGFRPGAFQDVALKSNEPTIVVMSTLQRVKQALADGNVVGISISMPERLEWAQRVQGTRFVGMGKPFVLKGGHAMVVTDFKNSGGVFGPVADVGEEVSKEIEPGLVFRLKNSWGSQTGRNEFGQVVKTGFYDMDIMYIVDVLKSTYPNDPPDPNKVPVPGFVTFTFPIN
jgi:hypothetical protein